MPRYFYFWALLILAALLGATAFFSRTQPPVASQSSIGEFGGVSLRIEFATTSAAREKGLGGRKDIPSDYGMLFAFPKDGFYGFWMKDMLVPLDIFWLDDKGHVVSIAESVATSTYPHVFYPFASARYVLETAAGFTRTRGIATGTPLLLQNWPGVSE